MMMESVALGGTTEQLADISVIWLAAGQCVDFNYQWGDKTDQSSIEDRYTESQAIQSENKGEVGVAASNRLVVILRYREKL